MEAWPLVVTWHEHAILWHVYPLGFVGAEAVQPRGAQPVHRLTQLTAWLDYAVELGVSGILLGPVFSSSSHGYDTLDHLTIDPRLGDRDDFDALVREAHARGLKVVLDGVFNHVGVNHPLFRRALEGGPDAPESRLFRLTWNGDGEPDYADFEGHRGLVALDHDAPEVAELVREVMDHWLRAGADGWRLDAAYAVPPSFWRQVLPPLREAHPEMYVVGEVIHGDYAGIVAESGMDSVTQYELWKAIWSAIEERNLWELDHALGRHAAMIETFAPLTFVGNHDVTRIATRLTDRRHLPHALVVLMTVGGTPTIYYGDEQAFEGLKEERLGGDDAIRPAFPASPVELAPEGWPAYHLHQELVSLRRRHPWLHRARTQRLALENELLAYESVGAGGRLVVVLNLADDAATAPAPGTTEVLAGQGDLRGGEVTVPVHGWCVLG